MCDLRSGHDRSAEVHTYSAYGLGIRSGVALPATARSGETPDAEVRRAPLKEITAALKSDRLQMRVNPAETQLLLPDIGTFVVRFGREILVDADRQADDSLLQLAIMGPAFAALLQQRGCLVLHASAVAVGGAAVGFLGARGAGKSTMAAAMHDRGYAVLADDMLAVRLQDSVPLVAPGFPQLKLWPDVLVALGRDPDVLPAVRASYSKRAQPIPDRFAGNQDLPLACLYVLCRQAELGIVPLGQPAAFIEIVSHSYGVEWLHDVSSAKQFRRRAELVQSVPVRRLQRPADLDMVGDLIDLVEENLGRS